MRSGTKFEGLGGGMGEEQEERARLAVVLSNNETEELVVGNNVARVGGERLRGDERLESWYRREGVGGIRDALHLEPAGSEWAAHCGEHGVWGGMRTAYKHRE